MKIRNIREAPPSDKSISKRKRDKDSITYTDENALKIRKLDSPFTEPTYVTDPALQRSDEIKIYEDSKEDLSHDRSEGVIFSNTIIIADKLFILILSTKNPLEGGSNTGSYIMQSFHGNDNVNKYTIEQSGFQVLPRSIWLIYGILKTE